MKRKDHDHTWPESRCKCQDCGRDIPDLCQPCADYRARPLTPSDRILKLERRVLYLEKVLGSGDWYYRMTGRENPADGK